MDNTTYTVPQEAAQGAQAPATQTAEALRPMEHPPAPPVKRRRPNRRKKIVKNIIALVTVLGIIGALVLLTYIVFFKPAPEYYLTGRIEVWDTPIKNIVSGWGYLMPESSEDAIVVESGTVLEANVWYGAQVQKDDVLIVLDSSSIDKAVADIQKIITGHETAIEKLRGQIEDAYGKIGETYEELREANAEQYALMQAARLYAPFSGRIIDAEKLIIGTKIRLGDKLARLVDDARMKLTLYFSYGYENDIYLGQPCEVSIPSVMSTVTGHVTGIEKIRRVGADGSVSFEVEITMDNPGALISGAAATASMRTADGEDILPTSAGMLEYAREIFLTAESEGTLKQNNLRDYYTVSEGELLLTLDFVPDTSIEEGYMGAIRILEDAIAVHEANIEATEEAIQVENEKIELQYERMDDLIVRAPISGSIISYNDVWPGMTIGPGMQITVAQMQTLTLRGELYQSDIQKVQEGMSVDVDAYVWGEMTTVKGTLTSIERTANQQGGGSYYPIIVAVDNSMGQIMEYSGANFQIVLDTSSETPIIVPIQAIQGIGNNKYIFLKPQDGVKPENTVELPEGIVPPGFYAVLVKCGIQNPRYIEVIEGIPLEWKGWEVFTQKTDTLPSPLPSYDFEVEYEGEARDAFDDGYQRGLEDALNASPSPDEMMGDGYYDEWGNWISLDPWNPSDSWPEDSWPGDGEDYGGPVDDGYYDEDGNFIPFEPPPENMDGDGGWDLDDSVDDSLPEKPKPVEDDVVIIRPLPGPSGGGVVILP